MTERPSMDITQTGAQETDLLFDEDWYLNKYPAIAEEVQRGGFKSGLQHYLQHGRFEGRLPVPPGSVAAPANRGPAIPFEFHNGAGYLAPTDLTVKTLPLNRVALIGSCLLEAWNFQHRNPSECPVDLIVLNHLASLPTLTPETAAAYDFAVIQIPLRMIIGTEAVWRFDYSDTAAHEKEFARACEHLEFTLNSWMGWNQQFGMLTFVANFLPPQHNPMGRLFPRYGLANPEYFISRLNEHLETVVRRNRNAYILDLDRLSASVGRRSIQDDSFNIISHGSMMGFINAIDTRIEPMAPLAEHYELAWTRQFPGLIWSELVAMYRTVRQTDLVKVVVVDLDDTLWRGVSGDMDEVNDLMVEGWPIGFAEALMYLKKRGILLAIASKNDEPRIREIWPRIFGGRMRLEDFAAVKINWRPKSENMREILEGMNLLPRNAVFIDDNPAEREAMQLAFPDMRILGRYPYYLKRILLWSSETQVPVVTQESGRRTEMIQAQFARESQRKEMSREQFLRDAAVKVTLLSVAGTDHARFDRVFELINKTNQFNTTGRRWKSEECDEFLRAGGQLLAFEVSDRFTSYGLVGAVLFSAGHIEQWVMSCRVLGYQIEQAVVAVIVAATRAIRPGVVTGRLIHTDANFPCRELFQSCGFVLTNEPGTWALSAETTVTIPEHVTVTQAEGKQR
jgi:FkbH-like protein